MPKILTLKKIDHAESCFALQIAARARQAAGLPEEPPPSKDNSRLVRVKLTASPVAEEELSFAGVCSDFLAKAGSGFRDVSGRGKATQVTLTPHHRRLISLSNSHNARAYCRLANTT